MRTRHSEYRRFTVSNADMSSCYNQGTSLVAVLPDLSESYQAEGTYRTIGFGATISAPHMHAHACENLLPFLPKQGEQGAILDVGSGSGYREFSCTDARAG